MDTSICRIRRLVFLTLIILFSSSSFAKSYKSNESSDFALFETGQVRPIALSHDKTKLFVVNTPNNSLEIYSVVERKKRRDKSKDKRHLIHVASVPVGLEPVAVAQRSDDEVWVVNNLSDSVSIVNVSAYYPTVTRTLLVGDEPRDIIFAGENRDRAFITTAHRGQNVDYDPAYFQSGIGRADVWVFDANNLGDSLKGDPLTVLQLFGDTPRALAVSPDGSKVYAAIFFSGNKTTVIGKNNFSKAAPTESSDGIAQPDTSLIVKYIDGKWVDETGADYTQYVNYELPDYDVFEIDANANPPVELKQHSGVGTTLFNMAVNPKNGSVYVSNIEARNHVRFVGEPYEGRTSLKAHFVDNNITVIKDNLVTPVHVNDHIDYSITSGNPVERRISLSNLTDMVVSSDGSTLYAAAFGSSKVGIFSTEDLEKGAHAPGFDKLIRVKGGGPSGLALHEDQNLLYVLTRFNNAIAVVDLKKKMQIAKVKMFNPEPKDIIKGRKFLYDAELTSGHGDSACGSCHIFGDMDALAWDLGNPDGIVMPNPVPYVPFELAFERLDYFHPMKGPMATQSLRGMKGNGAMHWRGDKTGTTRKPGETVEKAAFKEFNEAFVNLMGRPEELKEKQMETFADFILQIFYPPNPNRFLDNTLSDFAEAGRKLYMEKPHDVFTGVDGQPTKSCNDCHTLNPAEGKFGTNGLMVATGTGQDMKTPHFRNYYQKVGKYGISGDGFVSDWEGPQIRGFGVNHEGGGDIRQVIFQSFLGIFHFDPVDDPTIPLPPFLIGSAQTNDFLIAFPSDIAPIVGHQVTLNADNRMIIEPRINVLMERALVTEPVAECDLIVTGIVEGKRRFWMYGADGAFNSDAPQYEKAKYSTEELYALIQKDGQALTFTCVTPGTGERSALDKNRNGVYDFDEILPYL